VTDPARRYLPSRFDLTLPAHGLALPDCIPPATPSDEWPVSIELFSAPTRPVPAGMAALRVEVWEARPGAPDVPVPWALLEVDAPLPLPARGLTDERGRGVVIFPYPEPTLFDTGSSPAGGRSLLTQSWNLTLRVFATPYDDWGAIPDLCRVLGQADDAPRTEVIATLHYGEEAHVATPPHTTLLLPAGSPV
jgi:hypothetical protein